MRRAQPSTIPTFPSNNPKPILLLNAFAILLLTILGAAGESLGMDRLLRTSTAKRHVHSLFRQGCLLYELIPNMPEESTHSA